MNAPQQFDLNEIRRSLELLLEPGSLYELRALNTTRGTVSGYFTERERLAQAAAHWSGRAEGVYITLNPVLPDLLARANNRVREWARHTTKDDEVLRRRRLLIDFDPKRPAGISATDTERAAALDRAKAVRDHLAGRGWDTPLLADSGNGAHLLYRIDLPNDEESRDQLSGVLDSLAARFSDDLVSVDKATFNASRISKVYGTLAAKGDSVPELGRVHRIARILEVPDAH